MYALETVDLLSEISIRACIPCRDVCRFTLFHAEKEDTYYRAVKYCKALSDAQQKKTAMHVVVNAAFRHSLFGIIAGF